MLAVRYRIQVLSDRLDGAELDIALHERWAEGTPTGRAPTRTVVSYIDAGYAIALTVLAATPSSCGGAAGAWNDWRPRVEASDP